MKTIIINAFIEILSGIAQYHEDGGVISEDKYNDTITISFPDNNPNKAMVKSYYKNGKKSWKEEYHQGQRHGKSLCWWENGNKRWETEYHQGQRHGKYLGWRENGKKNWEAEYHQGQLHGKYLCWYKNGNKNWEREYSHGKLIYQEDK